MDFAVTHLCRKGDKIHLIHVIADSSAEFSSTDGLDGGSIMVDTTPSPELDRQHVRPLSQDYHLP